MDPDELKIDLELVKEQLKQIDTEQEKILLEFQEANFELEIVDLQGKKVKQELGTELIVNQ